MFDISLADALEEFFKKSWEQKGHLTTGRKSFKAYVKVKKIQRNETK
jgi:hypothetical protein